MTRSTRRAGVLAGIVAAALTVSGPAGTAVTAVAAVSPAALPAPQPAADVPSKPPLLSPALAAAAQAAEAVQAKVDALRIATEVAVENYDEVRVELAAAQRRHDTAVRASRTAKAAQASADRIATERLRDLYISGGPPGLLDVTIGTPPGVDVFHRYDDSRFFLAQDRLRFVAAEAAAQRSATAEGSLAAALFDQGRLTRAAAAATQAVTANLASEQELLASAGAPVQAVLAAEDEAQQRRADALATIVRDVQRRTGRPGVAIGTSGLTAFVSRELAAAEGQLGKPYQWGAAGPAAFDCSGLVQRVFADAGASLPRTSQQQWFAGSHPAVADVWPGDLLFWAKTADPATIHHVAIYLGGGYMIAAPHSGTVVQVQPVYASGFFGVTRIAPPPGR